MSLADDIRDEVTAAIANDELELPTLPEVALRIRDAAQSENVSASSLANVLAEDPALAARLIKVANSPIFRAVQSIDDLAVSIGRIGVEYAAELATGLAMRQMFQATSDLIDRRLRSVWSHACEVAAISGVLAKTFTRLRPDRATLAGLTHSIGVLPILTFAEENDTMIRDSITLQKVIDDLQGSLGSMILQSWDFPEDVSAVPANYTNFEWNPGRPDLVGLVTVANLQSLARTDHPYASIDWAAIPAFGNIGLDPEFESMELEDYWDEVGTAQSILN